MSQDFQAGDFLAFQIESGFGVLRLLAIDGTGGDAVYHLAGYEELFPDIESLDAAIVNGGLRISMPHAALTQRAFESTQVARMGNAPLELSMLSGYDKWKNDPARTVSDRSIRLMLGLR